MRHVLFDFDGTLANSLPIVIDIAEELVGPLALSGAEIERLRNMSMRAVLKESKIPFQRIPRLVVRGRTMLKQRMAEMQIFDGLEKVVNQLHAEGYTLHVVSSNSEGNIRSFLRRYKIEQCFQDVTGNVGLFSKTAALKKLLRSQKIDLYDAVYIGDEVRDIEASRKLGLSIISVTWGYNGEKILRATGPDVLVKKPSELRGAVIKIGNERT